MVQDAAQDATSLRVLNAEIVECDRCARLRNYCAEVARVRRRAYADWEYWGRPVPSFGDEHARVLALGLAPGAHGSNRTGRPFTGDGSGDFLFPVLHEAGFASQATAISRDDGMKLSGLWISAVVRCAPPGNKPTPAEEAACRPFLISRLAALPRLKVIVTLGDVARRNLLKALGEKASAAPPGHGGEAQVGRYRLINSYHCSRLNTNTGRLTAPMFEAIFERARTLLED